MIRFIHNTIGHGSISYIDITDGHKAYNSHRKELTNTD